MGWLDKLKKNTNLMRFIETTQKRITESEMSNYSVVVAYYLLLSLFPLLIAVGNLLPFLKINPNDVLPYIEELMPPPIFDFLRGAIKDLLTQSSGSMLSISALTTLWSASQSINALQTAMNKAYGVEARSNFVIVRIVSFVVVLLLMIAIIGVVGIFGMGEAVLDALQPIFGFSLNILDTFAAWKWPLTLVGLFVIMMLLYLIVPNAKLRWRSIVPGAAFSTIGWLLLSQVFGIYTKLFNARIAGYQIIGGFIILMFWLNFAAMIMIFGGIINAVIEEYFSGKAIQERHDPNTSLINRIKARFRQR